MVERLRPEELKERLDSTANVQVVDVRPEDAFAEGHIPSAINVPLGQFAEEIESHEWGEEVVVVCPVGESSRQAARLLESYEGVGDGTTVANLTGGYEAWEYDLESGAGPSTS